MANMLNRKVVLTKNLVIPPSGQVFDGNGNPVMPVDVTIDIHDHEFVPKTIAEVHEMLGKDVCECGLDDHVKANATSHCEPGSVEHAIAIIKILGSHPNARAWVGKRNPR